MNSSSPQPQANQGAPWPRIAARLKVTGEARYAADIAVANVAYGVLVTSDVARGEVRSIALEAARTTPGVLAVFSYGDMQELNKPSFGTNAAMANAVFHATGVRLRTLPIRLDDLLAGAPAA